MMEYNLRPYPTPGAYGKDSVVPKGGEIQKSQQYLILILVFKLCLL